MWCRWGANGINTKVQSSCIILWFLNLSHSREPSLTRAVRRLIWTRRHTGAATNATTAASREALAQLIWYGRMVETLCLSPRVIPPPGAKMEPLPLMQEAYVRDETGQQFCRAVKSLANDHVCYITGFNKWF